MFSGRVTQRGGEPVLIVQHNGEQVFDLWKMRDGVYEVIDEDKQLIVNGAIVDIIITQGNDVTHFCEAEEPADILPSSDVEIETF